MIRKLYFIRLSDENTLLHEPKFPERNFNVANVAQIAQYLLLTKGIDNRISIVLPLGVDHE
ncbi:MAG: hypothetical protein D6772_12020 [Bacteroidetes bacterium]|nr:MAG: hypothetical protein D6772_12020 [Bacteroidota bacterium]